MKHFDRTAIGVVALFTLITMNSFSQTVYVQETGKKYHIKTCSVAGNGKKGMTIADAKKAGYVPCKVCKPVQAAADKPRQADKPKEGEKQKSADIPQATEPKKIEAIKPKD